jgi:hypothetical protein
MVSRRIFDHLTFGFEQDKSTLIRISLMAGIYEPEVGLFRSCYLLQERYILAHMEFIGTADRPEGMTSSLEVFQR